MTILPRAVLSSHSHQKENLDTDTANETEKQACTANKQRTKIQTWQSISRAHSPPAACQQTQQTVLFAALHFILYNG